MKGQRGLRSQMKRIFLPVAAYSVMALVAGCGGTSTGGGSEGATAPVVDGVLPMSGPPSGGTAVIVTGSGFQNGVVGTTTVSFAGFAASDVVVVDDNTITAVTPAVESNELEADVEVSNSRGSGILASGFHYLVTAGLISDLNSDGIPDIAIAASTDGGTAAGAGAVFVFYGQEGMVGLGDRMATESDVQITGSAEGDHLGAAVMTGDVNGDGHTDLLIGIPLCDNAGVDAGEVAIFLGPLPESGSLSAADASVVLSGESTVAGAWWGVQGDKFGTAISLGDANSDGIFDILVGAPGVDLNVGQSDEIEDAGRAYLFLGGSFLASAGAADAYAIIDGVKEGDQLGIDVCMVDLNADGRSDLAVACDVLVSGPNHRSQVGIFTTEGQVQATSDDAEIVLTSSEDNDRFGMSLASGDVNGDGSEDLIVGAPFSNSFSSSCGRAYVFLGGEGSASGIAQVDSDVIFTGQLANTNFGSEIASADVNGDGFGDVMVGAPFTTFGATWDGQVFVFFGSAVPADSVAYDSDVILSGEEVAGERFGTAIEVLDSNMDGIADIMSSATGHGELSGRVYVFHGEEAILDQGADEDDMTLTGESEGGSFGSSISRGK